MKKNFLFVFSLVFILPNISMADVSSNIATNTAEPTAINSTDIVELTGKEIKGKTVAEVADYYKINSDALATKLSDYLKVNIKPSESFQLLHDNYGLEPSFVSDLAKEIKNSNNITTTSSVESVIEKQKISDEIAPEKNYFVLQVSSSLILLYIITFVLAKKKIISEILHKKIWNNILLFVFLGMGILGLLLAVRIQYGVKTILPFNMLFWHVEFGITMAIISIFHVLWHIKYYINIKNK